MYQKHFSYMHRSFQSIRTNNCKLVCVGGKKISKTSFIYVCVSESLHCSNSSIAVYVCVMKTSVHEEILNGRKIVNVLKR